MSTSRRQTVSLSEIVSGAVNRTSDIMQITRAAVSGVLLSKEKRHSIGLLLQKQTERFSDNPAILFDEQAYNYTEFNENTNRVAHLLESSGVTSGDVVAVYVENRPEALFAAVGTTKLGATASMINTSQRGNVLTHSLNVSKPRAVIVGEELLDALDEVLNDVSVEPFDVWVVAENDGSANYDWQNAQVAHHPALKRARFKSLNAAIGEQSVDNPSITEAITLDTPAFYVFTSGTTGMPKASIMSHLRWMRACYGVGQASVGVKPSDVFYCALPLYHNNALTLSLSATIGGGAALAIARKFSASRFWDDVRKFDATLFCYIGEFCRYLLAQPKSDLDAVHQVRGCMGNGLRAEIWADFQERFQIESINEFYASSEGNVAFINAFGVDQTAGFCPFSFAIVQYDIDQDEPVLNEDNYMKRVDRGEVGLLITEVTERMSFDGYTDESASNRKLLHNVFKEGDTWFNTGDLVRNQGYKHIQFVDRLGDTFRWKGENVATTEVESVINEFDAVDTAVVYGVQVPGADGRCGMVALVLECELESFNFEEFAKFLHEELPAYAVPRFLRIRKSEEITVTFKHKKVDLKKQGFDPREHDEPVYGLLDSKTFSRIEASNYDEVLQQITDKSIRL